jgi:hypothetical protein
MGLVPNTTFLCSGRRHGGARSGGGAHGGGGVKLGQKRKGRREGGFASWVGEGGLGCRQRDGIVKVAAWMMVGGLLATNTWC